MTVLIVVIAVLVVAGAVLATTRRRHTPHLKEELLGNPHPPRNDPLVRPESRHNDTPAGADLDKRSHRYDD